METRDIIRMYKKGGILFLAMVAGGFLLARVPALNLMAADKIIDDIIVNPGNFANIIGIGLAAALVIFLAYPFVLGYLVEEIDKRVRR
jgi:ABC-type multidrug transport system fused ATPase/permease subunit